MSTPPESGEFHPTKPIEYRIVLVGRTGEGKSATANTIFGRKIFKSSLASKSVTKECQSIKDTVFGRDLLVVDTPGLFDTESSHEEIGNRILKFVALTAPGPHIFLLVMKIGRATDELQDTYARLCKLLGNKGHPYTIIVFTCGDDLEDGEDDGTTIDEYLLNATASQKAILANSGYRYVVFNNKEKDKQKSKDQVNKLIQKIDDLVQANNGGVFGSEMYDDAEEALIKKEIDERDALLKKNEAENTKLKERLREKQQEIESFHFERTKSFRVKQQLQHREEQFSQMEREYEKKIAEIEQEHEAKAKSLEDQLKKKFVLVRDETRQKINEDTLKVSDSWFKAKLKRFLKI